jgi:hypothetical protein
VRKRKAKKPSQTRRHRESVAAKRRARAFYRQRRSYGADVLDREEAEGLAPWRGCGVVLAVVVASALVGWMATKLFS